MTPYWPEVSLVRNLGTYTVAGMVSLRVAYFSGDVAVGSNCADRRRPDAALLRSDAIRQRRPLVLCPTADRQDDPAVAGRHASSLEYLHGRLSGDAPRRLCLHAHLDHLPEPAPATADPVCAPPVAAAAFHAPVLALRADAADRGKPGVLAAMAAARG